MNFLQFGSEIALENSYSEKGVVANSCFQLIHTGQQRGVELRAVRLRALVLVEEIGLCDARLETPKTVKRAYVRHFALSKTITNDRIQIVAMF